MKGVPPLLSTLPRPILGYYGAIAEWFDSTLVAHLARERPTWTFVLIGHTRGANLKPFKDLPNVHVLPEQDYLDLPSFLHAFDVCLIPFRKTPLTHATNPVKLFEYCASGKPIVASALQELRSYEPYVRLPETRADWLREIESALVQKSATDTRERIRFARENTWKQRVRTLKPWLDTLFPKVSILVVTYENLDLTRLCLESVYARTIYPDFEVIVVDNHSSDGTVEYLRNFAHAHENCRILPNDSNLGFAQANNQAARLAAGAYLVFLNNDTIVTRNWLAPLIARLADNSIGIVGPVTNWSGNETRIPVPYRALSEIEDFSEAHRRTHDGRSFEIRMLPFCCVGMRRAVFEEIGPLDERYGIGMFEDDDYAMRVRAKGYRILCVEDSFIHHWGRASFEKLDQKLYDKLFEDNRRQFETKWGVSWEPHRWREFRPPLSG